MSDYERFAAKSETHRALLKAEARVLDLEAELAGLRERLSLVTEDYIKERNAAEQAEAEIERLKIVVTLHEGERDRLDCTLREGGNSLHCPPARLCWRCRAERADARLAKVVDILNGNRDSANRCLDEPDHPAWVHAQAHATVSVCETALAAAQPKEE